MTAATMTIMPLQTLSSRLSKAETGGEVNCSSLAQDLLKLACASLRRGIHISRLSQAILNRYLIRAVLFICSDFSWVRSTIIPYQPRPADVLAPRDKTLTIRIHTIMPSLFLTACRSSRTSRLHSQRTKLPTYQTARIGRV